MRAIPVLQLTEGGRIIREFESASEAARETGINQRAISRTCKYGGTAGEFIWVHADKALAKEELEKRHRQKEAMKYCWWYNIVQRKDIVHI